MDTITRRVRGTTKRRNAMGLDSREVPFVHSPVLNYYLQRMIVLIMIVRVVVVMIWKNGYGLLMV